MINTVKLLNRWTVVAGLAILAACGGGGGGGGIAPPMGTDNTIVATPSPTGVISVAVGESQAFSVTFTTSDGNTASNFSITSGLSTLPAGWTGPTSLACASVSTGSGCVANLTFKPTAASTGAVTFNYSYTNNAGTSKTGTATVSYTSTSDNIVVATPSPKAPITVVTGGHSTVGITFTTDDGATATNLSITSGLSALPAGWSGPAHLHLRLGQHRQRLRAQRDLRSLGDRERHAHAELRVQEQFRHRQDRIDRHCVQCDQPKPRDRNHHTRRSDRRGDWRRRLKR